MADPTGTWHMIPSMGDNARIFGVSRVSVKLKDMKEWIMEIKLCNRRIKDLWMKIINLIKLILKSIKKKFQEKGPTLAFKWSGSPLFEDNL